MYTEHNQRQKLIEYIYTNTCTHNKLTVWHPAEHLKQHLRKALEKSILVLFLCLSH